MVLMADFHQSTFPHTYGACNYRIVFASLIVPYMCKLKAKLIATIEQFGQEGAEAKAKIEKFDYLGYDQDRGSRVIARMLGRKRKESEWKQRVHTLVRHLQ